MSLNTWTPAAIVSKARGFTQTLCRLVVKSGHSSLAKITDTEDELIRVEIAIRRQQDFFDNRFRDLHPLLKMPFLAKAYAGGSRFRGEFDSGVFYGADKIQTAVAERGYHHHRFVKNSPNLITTGPTPFTFFTVKISMKVVDIRVAPFSKASAIFEDKNSYADTQRFASVVRQSGVLGIKYTSVRSPHKGSCVAMLSPAGFASKQPSSWDENWLCIADAKSARWINNSSQASHAPMSFDYA